jgi:hypothetical protein
MRAGHVRPRRPASVDWLDVILIVAAVGVAVLCVLALVTLSDPPAPPG